ncbi:hypothetical protein C8A05DRAFT_15143 [Staphylotrichum tortipilum]|uniref:SRR1-like domain-containing protein n=1 Tax=Staphylotrichum tortipilum TaxID=2831512 RepID=A0AAN6MLJ2_9PEZI|nr:hypothetical protein C8A05DRAFT_15143 [Staphylotrichum longicolle]
MKGVSTAGKAWVYFYRGKAWELEDLRGTELAAKKRFKEESAKRLRELYDQGVPFFSKAVFRHVLDQLNHCRANPDPPSPHIISIPTLNDSAVECELETGVATETDDKDVELVIGHPHLHYRTFHHLTSPTDDIFWFSQTLAYAPTILEYPMAARHVSTGVIPPPDDSADAAQVREKLAKGIAAWEASAECARLRGVFEAGKIGRVTKIAAFACSTMAVKDDDRANPVAQHAAVLMLRELFARRGAGEVRCLAQDPMYRPADVEVLQELGVEVLEDPRGFLEVDEETVVVCVAPNVPVRQVVADIARPVAMVWGTVKGEVEAREWWERERPGQDLEGMYSGSTDPDSPRLRDMVEKEYVEAWRFGDKGPFGRQAVYIRRAEKAEGPSMGNRNA